MKKYSGLDFSTCRAIECGSDYREMSRKQAAQPLSQRAGLSASLTREQTIGIEFPAAVGTKLFELKNRAGESLPTALSFGWKIRRQTPF
jgi:hypothetical protein